MPGIGLGSAVGQASVLSPVLTPWGALCPQELPFETQSQPHIVSSKKSPEARGSGKEVEKQNSCSAEGVQGGLAGGNVWWWVQKASLDGGH